MELCKNDTERENLLKAIADMELAGQATLTMDTKIRTKSYELALIEAGLSPETINSILEQGDMSGFIGSNESQLAESYLRQNLRNGNFVEKADVDTVIQQYQKNIHDGNKTAARVEFEASMQQLCKDSKKFDPETLAAEQIRKGKSGIDFEVYRNDNHAGLSIAKVPKANIAANRDEIIADLKQQHSKAQSSASGHIKGAANSAKDLVGDAEHQSKATLQMTVHALGYILGKFLETAKKLKLVAAMKSGNVDIQDAVNHLIGLEKDQMIDEMKDNDELNDDWQKKVATSEFNENECDENEELNLEETVSDLLKETDIDSPVRAAKVPDGKVKIVIKENGNLAVEETVSSLLNEKTDPLDPDDIDSDGFNDAWEESQAEMDFLFNGEERRI